jgi:hypothetical protein
MMRSIPQGTNMREVTKMRSIPSEAMSAMLSIRRPEQAVARPAPSAVFSAGGPRIIGAKLPFEVVPDYVATCCAVCDMCGKSGVRFGFHAPPDTDLCVDCFHKFQTDKGPDIDALTAKRNVQPGQTKFVEFQPLR